jgi:hypothetical protein
MTIKVNGFKIRHNGVIYSHDEVIEKIKDDEAKRLVEAGHAFFVEKKSSKRKAEESLPPAE